MSQVAPVPNISKKLLLNLNQNLNNNYQLSIILKVILFKNKIKLIISILKQLQFRFYYVLLITLNIKFIDHLFLNKTEGGQQISIRLNDTNSKINIEALSPSKLYKAQQHSKAGEFVKSAVYGGLDGLIITLNVAISGIGSSVGATTIVAIGLASLVADGLSMGIADYLATKSDDQFMQGQQQRQRQQMQHDFQAQKQQMFHLYQQMGLQPKVSGQIVDIISSNREGFLKIMMIEQLQLIAGQQSPFTNSIITFFSFGIFGLMPLIPFIIAEVNNFQINFKYAIASIAISVFFLFVIGFGKSFVTSAKWYASSLQTIFVGAFSASIAYGVGALFNI